ncbi:hypothetical protein H5A18_11710 [Pectobacterium brasiliense]|uniref:hypothetical protein n=1 Tax=Pectobacterium brasiliense TaxID=180957 RepID=UPI000CE69682|nr:hypothetical protein [Pectobacterium brasiliense]MBN3182568.1 hypothetical protein [Pectobacterium brasiliense]PPE64800.1 hypothetical protein F152LOC_00266 [Pectobacterium brasiliense]
MTTATLQTEQEYLAALSEVEPLFDLDLPVDSVEEDRFLSLCTAIHEYEKIHFPECYKNQLS